MHNSKVEPARVKPASKKGAAYITDFLIQQKVPYVFGVCGHGILGLLDGLFDRQDEIKTISVHHESAAGFMAEAYFRITQKPVATYTSCGPGSANLILAIAGAFADSSAMLNITGNVPTGQWNRGPRTSCTSLCSKTSASLTSLKDSTRSRCPTLGWSPAASRRQSGIWLADNPQSWASRIST